MSTASRALTAPPFSAKDPAEVLEISFDFLEVTSAPITPQVTVVNCSGVADSSPGTLLSGSPTVSGSSVVQRVVGGLAGADYLLRCQVDTATGLRFVLSRVLPVRVA